MSDNTNPISTIGSATERALGVTTKDIHVQATGPKDMENKSMSYLDLNALLAIPKDGKTQFWADKEAARQYFLQHVNPNTVFFYTLEEKLDYLVEEGYYNENVLNKYSFDFVKSLFKKAYEKKFRFDSFMGAYKFYMSYGLKDYSGARYLERYEDRVCMIALTLADGDENRAVDYMEDIISLRVQPSTPIMLNAGLKNRGEMVSCQLIRSEDNMESIGEMIKSSLQLSKRGGGVGLLMTNLREAGAPIKNVDGQASGLIPVMKMLEDAFKYANQLGARQGAGAAYVSVHHPDVFTVLDSKKENADEAIRIKTLSIGLVLTDKVFELAKKGKDFYMFSPYDVERVYGKPMSDISINDNYDDMVENPNIRKTKASARRLFTTIAEIQFESGYPYLMFEDTVNAVNNVHGRINMSNLCQPGDARLNTNLGYKTLKELYDTQADFEVVVDERARTMNLDNEGSATTSSTRVFKTAENAQIYKITTKEGFVNRATEWHKYYVVRDGSLMKIQLNEIHPGDQLLIQSGNGSFGTIHDPETAFLAGAYASDGTIVRRSENHINSSIDLFGNKKVLQDTIEEYASVAVDKHFPNYRSGTGSPVFSGGSEDGIRMYSASVAHALVNAGVDENRKTSIPEFVFSGDRETVSAYLSGRLSLDGSVSRTGGTAWTFSITSIDVDNLRDIQMLLLNFGVYSRIHDIPVPDGGAHVQIGDDGKEVVWNHSPAARLIVNDRQSRDNLADTVDFLPHQKEIIEECNGNTKRIVANRHNFLATVVSIEDDGVEDVYDPTVEDGHSVIYDGIATGQCSEITQVNSPSTFNADGSYDEVGKDISCNLASLNIKKSMETGNLKDTVENSIRMLTSVSDQTSIDAVPTIKSGNDAYHSVGLGAMNLHGFLAGEELVYGTDEALDFVNTFFGAMRYHALNASSDLAVEKGERFFEYELSKYHDPEGKQSPALNLYTDGIWLTTPQTDRVKEIFDKYGQHTPTVEDWNNLSEKIAKNGLYNSYLLAVAPNGSSSYQNFSTSSLHPIVKRIERRKEGKLGSILVPAPGLTDENKMFYPDAYEVGPEKIIDTYAVAQKHVDQALSCTLFFWDTDTTRDLNRAYIYAWSKHLKKNDEGELALYDPKVSYKHGLMKTLYYSRVRSIDMKGTEIQDIEVLDYDECVACQV